MLQTADSSIVETLRNGLRIEIRALRPDDRPDMFAAVDRMSPDSLYRRFFGPKRHFSEKEVAFFLVPDFVDHVAIVAVLDDGWRPAIVGSGRYIVTHKGTAEVAFAVVDAHQGQGIGSALLRNLVAIARRAGLKHLVADVLPHNEPMLKVFKESGLHCSIRREARTVHVTLDLS
jgi:RimJ/RimL family protein N-acetyltransferase